MKPGLSITFDKVDQVMSGLKHLGGTRVMVGIPGDKAEREPDPGEKSAPLNNAEIGYIMEHGAPEINLPAREFLRPGIIDGEDKIVARLRDAGTAALDGHPDQSDRNLNAAGLVGQNSVRAKITAGIDPALSEATLRNRIRSGKAVKGARAELDSRAAGNDPGTDLAKPLIWTGQLLRAISYVVRKVSP